MTAYYKRSENFRPDFSNLEKVLRGEVPDRPTLFDYALNERIIGKLTGEREADTSSRLAPFERLIKAFARAGYDYTTISAWRTNTLDFPKGDMGTGATHSLNAGNMITDRDSFEKYPWPDASKGDYQLYADLKEVLPEGMKLIASGPGGILENVFDIVGFENISIMTLMDEELATEIFDAIGERLLKFYELVAPIETIGACIYNDDWGFKNQTMLDPEMLRRWVFPWVKKIVEVIHKAGKLAILHSCGRVNPVMDDIIDDMKFDAKHSYEDLIVPVEEAYEMWGDRIAILGGIDMDFLTRRPIEEIEARCEDILRKSMVKGGYALGSGNSIPDYIPDENFLAMISSVNRI